MKRVASAETPRRIKGVATNLGNVKEATSADDDYRFCHSLIVAGHVLKNVILPFGACRMAHIFKPDAAMSNEYYFPVCSKTNLSLYDSIMRNEDTEYTHREPADDTWHFSVVALFNALEVHNFIDKCKDRSLVLAHASLCREYQEAFKGFNRDALAVIYAMVDGIMRTLFNMHFRATSTLNIIELLDYLCRLYREGLEVAFTPCHIPLWSKLTKKSIQVISSASEIDTDDEQNVAGTLVALDDPDEPATESLKDYDNDEQTYDPNIALDRESQGLTETLLLQNIPMQMLLAIKNKEAVQPRPNDDREGRVYTIFKDGVPIASKVAKDVALPFPSFQNISDEKWTAFVLRKIIAKFFFKNMHYYCTPMMLRQAIALFNLKYTSGRFPVEIKSENMASAINLLIKDQAVVAMRGQVVVGSVYDGMWEADNVQTVRFFSMLAYRQEEEILQFMDSLMKKRPTASQVFHDSSFCAEQIDAINAAIRQPLTFITGPGGSGKTTVMKKIYWILRRKYGPKAHFLLLSFRNVIVSRLAEDAENIDSELFPYREEPDKTADNQARICRTFDHLITNKTRLTPVVVIVEEAGQASGAHFQGLCRYVSDKVRHVIFFGDHQQRAPLKQGAPFKHLMKVYPEVTKKLVEVHRTNCASLRAKLDQILLGDAEKVLEPLVLYSAIQPAPMSDDSFVFSPVANNRGRMYDTTMKAFETALYVQLQRIDPSKNKYHQIMILCPYNDYTDWCNAIVTQRYFDGKYDTDTVCDNIRQKKNVEFIVYKNMRVAFKQHQKDEKAGRFCRGQIGIITHILEGESCPSTVNSSTASLSCISEIVRAGAVYIKLLDNERTVRLECGFKGRGLASWISVASCFTVDRSQGLEMDYVIAVCPWGINLATRDVIYTMASRAKRKLVIIGSESHVSTMIKTPSMSHNTQFSIFYKEVKTISN